MSSELDVELSLYLLHDRMMETARRSVFPNSPVFFFQRENNEQMIVFPES